MRLLSTVPVFLILNNEGANPFLSLAESGVGREILLAFDLSDLPEADIVSASLVLTFIPDELPPNWEPSGRTVDAHKVLEP